MGEKKVKMAKELGLMEGVAIILGIIFGSGIFISPKEVLVNAGSLWAALLVWAGCGLLATLGAMSYTELGTTMTKSGGDYHYINEAYGQLFAFLYLWDANLVFVPSTNAIMAMTFANNILEPMFPDCPVSHPARKLIAAATICILTFINAYDVKFTTRIQNVFMFTKIAALVIIIIGGIVWILSGNVEHLQNGWEGTKTNVGDLSIAFYSGIFSYSGWSYLNFMTEELRDPYTNLPRAIYVSLPMVTTIYLLANLSYLVVLGTAGVKESDAIAVDFATASLGWMRYVMPILVAIAVLGGLSVHIMTSSRMCFAGARNGQMPEVLAHVNIKCLSPMPSLVFLMLMSLLMLIPDNLTSLITYCTVVESFFTTLSCSAVLWLRYKKPELIRPIKVKLWIPIMFVTISTILLIVPIISQPTAVLAGTGITLLGVPVYYGLVRTTPKFIQKWSLKFTIFCQKLFLCVPEDDSDCE